MVPQATNQRIADRLLAEGRLPRADHVRVVEYAQRHKTRIEEALITLELLSEADLLKYIATVHGTRFVSTEKLSKAVIDARIVQRVARKVADLYQICPVLYDEATKTLTVVTPDPDNGAALHEVKLAAGVREVKALVARPAAVKAAILRHYAGDQNAFSALLRPADSVLELMNTQDPFARPKTGHSYVPTSRPPPADDAIIEAIPAPPRAPPPPPRPLTAPDLGLAAAAPVAAHPPPARPLAAPIVPPPAPAAAVHVTASAEFLEALNVLVSLLESSRQDLRGHSSTVARLMRKTCERIGLSAANTGAFVVAGYLHDLGKMGAYHLTALNVAEYDGHRIAATKAVELPAQLMSGVGLPMETGAAILSMYERYDGQGFPNGQSGKEIPLGARILAVVDTYADLTQNPRNPYRKILRPFEACDALAQYRGKIFDPNIVDLFRTAMTGDDLRQKLLADRHVALIIDPDPEETTVLELRMIEQGFEVKIARTAALAWRDLEAGDIEVVVSEIDLDRPEAGLELRQEANKSGVARNMTWVLLTRKSDRQTVQRAFDLGVDDVVAKPTSADMFVAKLRQLIDRRAARGGGASGGGVSGSLVEMGLPDIVQILWHGRKTCALRIQAQGTAGEIHFGEGQIVNALWGSLKGEEAFYKMLTLTEGDFRVDPTFKPTVRIIQASPEGLLLEGMRRLDEHGR